ncbi:MAG: hypothetical protein Q7S81_00480 [bacterium]|nr:hypothetical protein [bacterium]
MTIKEFKNTKPLFYPFLVSGGLILTALIVAVLNFYKINNLLIMHYDGYKGIDFLGDKGDVFSLIGISATMIILNAWLANRTYFRERFLAYLFSFSSLALSVLILIGVFAIISIN